MKPDSGSRSAKAPKRVHAKVSPDPITEMCAVMEESMLSE